MSAPAPEDRDLVGRLRAALEARPAREVHEPGRRLAAVAVIAVPGPDSLLFIRRSLREGDPWSGHVAFPGGGVDQADASPLDAAIRETCEEVGCVLPASACLGTLDDVAPRTPVLPPITVRPFLFHLPARPELHLGPEVASAVWRTLAELVEPSRLAMRHLALPGGAQPVQGYDFGDDFIWGMTERILTPLLGRLASPWNSEAHNSKLGTTKFPVTRRSCGVP